MNIRLTSFFNACGTPVGLCLRGNSRRPSPNWPGFLTALALALAATVLEAAALRGTVRTPEGRRLEAITVRFEGARDPQTGRRAVLGEGISDSRGRVRVDLTTDAVPALVALDGPSGIGRLQYVPRRWRSLDLRYPVRDTIVILHDNDLHFNWNAEAAYDANLAAVRAGTDPVFLLNAGDIFIRHIQSWIEPLTDFYGNLSRGMVERMNRAGYDAMTLGNHELDYIGELTGNALALATFPLLAANIGVTDAPLPSLAPYTVLTTATDVTLAVLGLSYINFQKDGLTLHDAIETAEAHRHLAAEHDVFVGLTHVGYATDRRLAQAVPEFDVIIGGHSHTLLDPAQRIGDVLVAQAGGIGAGTERYLPVDPNWPRYLGKITLELENGRVIGRQGRLAELSPTGSMKLQFLLDRDADQRRVRDRRGRATGRLTVTNTALMDLSAEVQLVFPDERSQRRSFTLGAGQSRDLPVALPLQHLRDSLHLTLEAQVMTAFQEQPARIEFGLNGLPRIAPITVDGDLSDWPAARRFAFDHDTIRRHPQRLAARPPPGAFEGEILLAWDGAHLCLGVRVRDAHHVNRRRYNKIWDGDAVQFAIAPLEPRRSMGFDPHDLLAGMALTDHGMVFHRWNGPHLKGHRVAVTRDAAAGETRYECAIPLANLQIPARAGTLLALNVVVLNDDTGEGMSAWHELRPGIVFGQQPAAFDTFMLMD